MASVPRLAIAATKLPNKAKELTAAFRLSAAARSARKGVLLVEPDDMKHVLPQVNAERLNVHDVLPLGEQFELFYPRRGRTIPLAKEMTGVSR